MEKKKGLATGVGICYKHITDKFYMLDIKFFGGKDSSGFNRDYLLYALSTKDYGGKRFTDEKNLFDYNLRLELDGGTQNFLLDINGKRVLGNEKMGDGLQTHGLMREMNNAFFDLITKDSGKFNLNVGGVSTNMVRIKKVDHDAIFSMDEPIGIEKRKFDNDATDIAQAVEEVIQTIKEYKEIWLNAIKQLQPQRENEILEIVFGKAEKNDIEGRTIKMLDLLPEEREGWNAWLPLAEQWGIYTDKKSKK